jgi:predicted dehydrogenase
MQMGLKKAINLGLIGCGSFGQFCLQAFSQMPAVRIYAIADLDHILVNRISRRYGCRGYHHPEELIKDPEVEIVHIVTPPSTHHYLGLLASRHGKHVLCEKPLALTITEGKELLKSAKKHKVIIPVNFVLRHVPIVDIVRKVILSGVLGDPLRAYFENYATDENLDSSHWFWDKNKSGGIFIEHGVHFFDLYRYWFGEAEIVWAHSLQRDSTSQEDRVMCVLLHQKKILATHYHGFDQPKVLDRQVHQIIFERGEVTVNGWIPESFSIRLLADDLIMSQIIDLCPDSQQRILNRFSATKQKMRGRGKKISTAYYSQIDYNSKIDKQQLYTQAIINLLQDQINYLKDPRHDRVIREENGLESLCLAIQASKYANEGLEDSLKNEY